MRTLDAIEHIRSHPEMYLPEGKADPSALAKRLAGDAFLLGATNAGYGWSGDWWFVVADKDWLHNSTFEMKDVFTRIIPFPEAGPNAVRTEVLLYAFAKEIVAFTHDRSEALKGGQSAVRSARDLIADPLRSAETLPWQARPPAQVPLLIAFRILAKDESSPGDRLRP